MTNSSKKPKRFKIKKHNKNLPLVSVIIPCYNYGHFLEEAIDSVLNQTLTNLEIIVVNDGSSDPNTIAILNNLDKPKTKVIHQKNLKQATARNNGIKKAKGKYICCLDADDKLEPTYLEECVTKMEIEKLDLCGTWTQLFGEENSIWKTEDLDIDIIKDVNTIPCASVFTKKIWKKTGGYNPKVNGYEDWEFWISIAEVGGRGKIIPKPLFLYRKHGTSEISNALEKHNSLIKRIKELHPKLYNDKEYLDKIKKEQNEKYLARNPLVNLKNSGLDEDKLFLNNYIRKEDVLQKYLNLEEKIEKIEEQKLKEIENLNHQNEALSKRLKTIEDSYSFKVTNSLRNKVVDKVISKEKRKKIISKIDKN